MIYSKKFKYDSKNTWKVINKLLCKNKNKDITDEFLINGIKETNSKIIANAFAQHFSETGKIYAKKVENNTSTEERKMTLKTMYIEDNLFLHPTDREECRKLMAEVKPKSSLGVDGISNALFKVICKAIEYSLLEILNKSLHEGIFSNRWKIAKVRPRNKSNKKDIITNYQPVSLLPVISKLLEKLVNIRME